MRARLALVGVAAGLFALAVPPATRAAAPASATTPVAGRVGYDGHSFLIDGQRVYLWSGEFHPYRLPSPALWRDIFERMKAAGFNTASIYFSWGYHSAAPGRYDFTGVRDMDRLLDAARDAGIYVIARPGPYINAEVDSGGFPLWLTTRPVANRSPDPAYLAYADEWLTQIDRILARHQLNDGRGTVIAYQVENEFYDGSDKGRAYMLHLEQKARADGITVPLVGNHDGTFVTGAAALPVNGWDHYPQGFDCSHPAVWRPAPDMADEHGPGQPVFAAEYQGGAFDPWGGPGYAKCADLINDRFASVFYKSNVAAGATAQNFYMVYGGTSWGWQAIPQNYTSYDYGAAITEARRFDPKYYEVKRIGYLLAAEPAIAGMSLAAPARTDDPAVIDVARADASTGEQLHLIRHGDTTSTAPASVHLSLRLKEGVFPRVPQAAGTALTIDGRDAKLLLADVELGPARLVYSTSELMTHATWRDRDVAVLYGTRGTAGETVLRLPGRPAATVLSGAVASRVERGLLRLNYMHDGLARVLVAGGARPLLLLIADKQATERLWRHDTPAGPVLMLGGRLLRGAVSGPAGLGLTGDADADGAAEVFAPAGTTRVTWNGAPLDARATASGGLAVRLPAPTLTTIPALTDWRRRVETPEAQARFDDRGWRVADLETTASTTKPDALPVLFADDYGFHTGNTWYRGHFRVGAGAAAPTGLALKVRSGGTAGAFSVWLNGRFLGSVTGDEDGSFGFPAAALRGGDNVVSVLTVDMGHEEDYHSKGENRTARGILSARPLGAATAITWRIQGRRGGEGATDPVRGPYNEGGLFGEREGWHLGRGGSAGWTRAALPSDDAVPGVTWWRTEVTLDLPRGQDHSLGLVIADPPGRRYRATIFVNGWQFGNYVADKGPQRSFPIPTGVLDPNGRNTIAIAVWKTDASTGGLGRVSLVDYDVPPAP